MINQTNQLSEREREILRLVSGGLSNQQIANQLGISVNTVKVHLRNVFAKIGVASRAEAAMFAVRNGIVAVDWTPALVPGAEVGDSGPVVRETEREPAIVPPVEERAPPAPPPVAPVIALPPAEPQTKRRPIGARFFPLAGAILVLLLGVAAALAWPRLTAGPPAAVLARWQELPALRSPRAGAAAAVVGDEMFVIGGENENGVLGTVERYDVRFQTWAQLSNKPTPVTDVRAAVLGGKIYVPGGRRSADPKDVVAAFEAYDPRTETWEQLPDLPAPRSAYGLATLEGKLFLFGGWDGAGYRDDVWEYDPERGKWRERSNMPTARAYAGAVALNDTIWVLGGENDSGQLDVNEAYNPVRDRAGEQPWSNKARLPRPRSRFGAAAMQPISKIYALGGDSGDEAADEYDARSDSWQQIEAPGQSIGSRPGVVQQDLLLIALGGERPDGTYATNMQAYQALSTVFVPPVAR